MVIYSWLYSVHSVQLLQGFRSQLAARKPGNEATACCVAQWLNFAPRLPTKPQVTNRLVTCGEVTNLFLEPHQRCIHQSLNVLYFLSVYIVASPQTFCSRALIMLLCLCDNWLSDYCPRTKIHNARTWVLCYCHKSTHGKVQMSHTCNSGQLRFNCLPPVRNS